MAAPDAPRFSRVLSIVAVGVVALAIVGAGRLRGCGTVATQTTPARGGAPAPGRAASPGAAPTEAALASLTVAVTDEHGPLRDARVRLAPRGGDVLVVRTDAGGVARADRLAPGSWRISGSADGHLATALPARSLAPGSADRVELRLPSGGRTLRGTVSDTSGGPVAGARVEAAQLGPSALPDDAVASAVTADDGSYHMTVAEGALWVAVTSDDYAPQSRRVDVGPAGAVASFALVPGGAIEGTVVDGRTRDPVGGASVRARRSSREWWGLGASSERRATAGPDGRFRLTGLKPGDWQLDAAAPPRYSRDTVHVGLAVGEQVSHVELKLGAGLALRGRVVDDQGKPAPGATVHAVGRTTTTTPAGADGKFAFEGLRSSSYLLSAESPAYLRAGPTDVWLTDRDVDDVVVHVQRGLVVKGHVEPRQVCQVRHEFEVKRGRRSDPVPDVTTGPDGEFALGPFQAGPATLTARCANGDRGELRAQAAAGALDVVLAVTAGGSLAGRVVGGDGAPVPGASVVVTPPEVVAALAASPDGVRFHISHGSITTGDQAMTDGNGAFEIASLPPGTYGFQVLDRGKPLQARGAWPVIELAAGEHKTGLELAVEVARGVISGVVTGPDGAPLADAWVSAYPRPSLLDMFNFDGTIDVTAAMSLGPDGNDPAPPPVLTDAQGRYRLTSLFHVPHLVMAEAQRGQLRARKSGVVPDATADLQTQGVSTLSGTASQAGRPVQVFVVTLLGPTVAARSVTDGTFTFDHIDPGSYALHVESLDGGGVGQITVAAGAAASLDVALSPNGTVTGTLTDAAGKPVAGLKVVVADDSAGDRIRPPAITGLDGSFRIDHAPCTCSLAVPRPGAPVFVKHGLAIEPGKLLALGPIVLDAPPAR